MQELDPSTPLRVDSAEGGILTVHPGSAISASATGLVTTLTEAGDLRGLIQMLCSVRKKDPDILAHAAVRLRISHTE